MRSPLLHVLLAVLFILHGCARQPLRPIDNWDKYQTRLAGLNTWELQGKLGVRVPGDANSVYVDWHQASGDYAIRLSGPFGQGTTWIRGRENAVRLEQAGRAPLSAPTPEELVYEALGWELPIRDLHYWVRGIPAPASPVVSQERTEAGALAYLEQAGWQLSYSGYNNVGPWQLPGKIVAQRGELKLTLVIKQWQLP